MKRTQLKDALRNVWKQKVSWFSIVVVAMLSVMAYLGIHFASHGIAGNANRFFDQTHFRDIEITSTLLLTQDDIDAFLAVEGVHDAEGRYQTSGKTECNGARTNVDVVSLTERISTPMLLEGRLPEAANECVVEGVVLETLGLSAGDTIRITDAQGATAEHLLQSEFVITGVIDHADHACRPTQVPGNRYVVVLPEAFDRDALGGCFMKALLLLDGVDGMDRFSEAYESAVAPVMDRLDALRTVRTELRSAEIQAQYLAEITSKRAELDAGQAELEEARTELDNGWTAITEGEQSLAESAEQLAGSEGELQSAQQQLKAGKTQLDTAKAKLDAAKKKLDNGKSQLRSAQKRLERAESELCDAWEALEDAKEEIRSMIRSTVETACGDTTGLIPWASRANAPIGSKNATAMDFWITEDYKCDLNLSLEENITAFIYSDAISDEVLVAGYQEWMGFTEEVASAPAAGGELEEDNAAGEAEGSEEWEASEASGESEQAEDPMTSELAAAIRAELAAAAVAAISEESAQAYDELASSCAQWDEGHGSYRSGLSAYQRKKAEYQAGAKQYAASEQSYQKALDEYNAGRRAYEEGMAAYEQGLSDYEAGKQTLEERRAELEEGELQYAQGLTEYQDGAARLADAQAQIASLDPCRWVVLDITGNPSYLNIRNAVTNTADMGMTFALVFVLVGALVIYATVGRIIEEQRRLVGAAKALGLFSREIFAKYLFFGVSATGLGMLLGIAAGYFGIQQILLYVYGRYYVYGAGEKAFLGSMTLVVFLTGVALSSLAVWSACSALMRTSATSLMQEKTPEIRRKAVSGKRRKGSLYARLILRNMRSDLKRVVVTVVSVAGCCALLVAGFTMRQSVTKALNAQFDEITRYDLLIRFDPEVSGTAQSQLETLLTDAGTDWMLAHASTSAFSVNGKLLTANLLCGDLSKLDRFYARLDPEQDIALPREGEGVWIRQRLTELDGVAAGDTVTFYDSAMKPYEIPATGVFRIYAGQEMILDTAQYEAFFGQSPENNAFFIKLKGADPQTLKARALAIAGVEEITDVIQTRAMYQSLAAVLNLIALMFVGIAGVMAFFILLNLVNMQLNQKKRELTIMRINGFSVREVKAYILRESILSTSLGILLGLGSGSLLGYQVIRLLEGVSVRFMRGIQWEAWGIGAAITVVYAVIIYMAALREVKRLNLADLS